jgi:predicted TIM-barrel fold metal-dependent hydrolase
MDMPATFHAGGGTPDFTENDAAAAVFLTEIQFYSRRSLSHLILSGVFERHPAIKVVFTETGTDWVAPTLQSLDGTYRYGLQAGSIIDSWVRPAMEKLSMLPSQYFDRNVWLGASFMSRPSVCDRYELGVDKFMWGTDYPHDEGTFPYATEALRHAFFDVAEAECRKMFGGTAGQLYGFDMEALADVAAKVGPEVKVVHTPLEAIPADTQCAAFSMARNF